MALRKVCEAASAKQLIARHSKLRKEAADQNVDGGRDGSRLRIFHASDRRARKKVFDAHVAVQRSRPKLCQQLRQTSFTWRIAMPRRSITRIHCQRRGRSK